MDRDLPPTGTPADRTDPSEDGRPRPAVNESPGVIYAAPEVSAERPDRGSRAGGVHMVDDPDQVGRASHLFSPATAPDQGPREQAGGDDTERVAPVQDVGVLAVESSVWEALEDAPAEVRQADANDGTLAAKPTGQG